MKTEDEFHFVLICPVHNKIQSVCLPNNDTDMATIDTVYILVRVRNRKYSTRQNIYNSIII